MKHYVICFIVGILSPSFCNLAQAQGPTTDEDELAMSYSDKNMLSISSGYAQHTTRAPAVATVITAADIEAIGATDLEQALETVPGLHVNHGPLPYSPHYVIRGIDNTYNSQVLGLINGIPVTAKMSGDRGTSFSGMTLENVARIEVIRGPGSALYGADAYSGVINIITKTAEQINGTTVGARIGSFSTRDAWMLHGAVYGDTKVAAYLRVDSTDGSRETIAADAQTRLDKIFRTNASLAPGPVNMAYKSLVADLDVANGKWRFRAGIKDRFDVGTGAGLAQALDPVGYITNRKLTSDLTYKDTSLAKDLDLSVQLSYFSYEGITSNSQLFPPGARFPAGIFKDGAIMNFGSYEHRTNLGTTALYSGIKDHRINLGAGFTDDRIPEADMSSNVAYVKTIPTPLPAVIDFYSPRKTRYSFVYAYAQDEWMLTNDLTLTGGIRRDIYSDFGGTTNPRLVLVWQAAYDLTAKFLAGRAFREPSHQETSNVPNAVTYGNPNIRPETISTQEMALLWQATRRLKLGANVFQYGMNDVVQYIADPNPALGSTAQNIGKQKGHGMELEAGWKANDVLSFSGNYAFQQATDEVKQADAGNAPHHHLYLRSDWRLNQDWSANAQINRVSDVKRVSGDVRPPVPNYHTVDATFRSKNSHHDSWDFAFSVRNLFNAAVFDPSPAPGNNIPYDLPMPRRSLYAQSSYNF